MQQGVAETPSFRAYMLKGSLTFHEEKVQDRVPIRPLIFNYIFEIII